MSLLERLNRVPDERFGYCRCGCGQKTTIAKFKNAGRGWVKGQPKLHCNGHASRTLVSVKVDLTTGCWNWLKSKQTNGYGIAYTDDGKHGRRMAHRMVWEWINRLVPKGKELDHICRNRGCVNPDHLRIVTRAENTQCGAVAKLNPDLVRDIRRLHVCGFSERGIAKALGLTRWAVRPVVIGRTWRNIDARG